MISGVAGRARVITTGHIGNRPSEEARARPTIENGGRTKKRLIGRRLGAPTCFGVQVGDVHAAPRIDTSALRSGGGFIRSCSIRATIPARAIGRSNHSTAPIGLISETNQVPT